MRLKDQSAQRFRRQTIVRLQQEGQIQSKIAELLEVSQTYVSRIIRSYRQNGERAFEVSTGKGAVSRLSEDQKAQLRGFIDAGAVCYGFEGELWTSQRVKRVIAEQFGVFYGPRQVQRLLKAMGYTPQKPQKVDHRQSASAVGKWKAEELPALKKSRAGKQKNCL